MIFRIPFSLIQSVLEPCPSPEILSDNFTQIGHECQLIYPAPIDRNVVVGKVVSVRKHENADKLKVCDVDVGRENYLQIVCGCPSVCEGMMVPVAQIGSKLGQITIKKSKLRGEVSEGMLCAARELGLDGHADGLMSLSDEFVVGQLLAELVVFNAPVLELDVTPNRGDCLSVYGALRDYVARYGGGFDKGVFSLADVNEKTLSSSETDKAMSFSSALLKCSDGDLPLTIKHQLTQAGIKLIVPVVDVLHLVMLLYGQPMHAYDERKLSGSLVAKQGVSTNIDLLDGQSVQTLESDIVICDEKSVVSLAGIMGGQDSMVTAATSKIYLEACYFDSSQITVSNRHHKIQSDAAMRYERGVDPCLSGESIIAAIVLMSRYDIAHPICVDIQTDKSVQHLVSLRISEIKRKLGLEIELDVVIGILKRLGCDVVENDFVLRVTVPSYRYDINQEIDLIEEIVRLYGYGLIELQQEPVHANSFVPQDRIFEISQFLSTQGFQEVVTYSLISQEDRELFALFEDVPHVVNPISQQMTHLRESVLPGIYKVARFNSLRQKNSHRYFEYSRVFKQAGEHEVFALLLSGATEPCSVHGASEFYDYYAMQAEVLSLLSFFGLRGVTFRSVKKASCVACAEICIDNTVVGRIEQLHPKFDLSDQPVFFAEIEYKVLKSLSHDFSYKAVSAHPEIQRDITWSTEGRFEVSVLLKEIANYGLNHLKDTYVFDIFLDRSVKDAVSHITTRIIFQSNEKTLTDKEIDGSLNKAIVDICESLKLKVG